MTALTIILAIAVTLVLAAWSIFAALVLQDTRTIRREIVDAGNSRRVAEKRVVRLNPSQSTIAVFNEFKRRRDADRQRHP